MSRARPAGASPCLTLAGELRQAIGSRQLRLYYQPVVECTSSHIGRVEALVGLGCQAVQGFHLGRQLLAAELGQWARSVTQPLATAASEPQALRPALAHR